MGLELGGIPLGVLYLYGVGEGVFGEEKVADFRDKNRPCWCFSSCLNYFLFYALD